MLKGDRSSRGQWDVYSTVFGAAHWRDELDHRNLTVTEY